MSNRFQYRRSEPSDIPAMARIRAAEWETEEFWTRRITGYVDGELHPQKALAPRASYCAFEDGTLVGFIAGHLTERFGCDGELEWINVAAPWRGTGVATELMRLLARWFADQNAPRVCVDPDQRSRTFYLRHGARELNKHWLVWDDIGIIAQQPARPAAT